MRVNGVAIVLVTLVLIFNPFSLALNGDQSFNGSSEPIEIYIKTLSNVRIKVSINLLATISYLKNDIQKLTGVPSGVQQLIFNRAMLKNERSLGEYNLHAGSIIYMVLFSDKITTIDDIGTHLEHLIEPAASNLSNGPIFHESDYESGEINTINGLSRDARNWTFDRMLARDLANLFEPTIQLTLTSFECSKLRVLSDEIGRKLRCGERGAQEADGSYLELRAQGLIGAKFQAHRRGHLRAERHGICLGYTWRLDEPLIANINNYAPDQFGDKELVRLFELGERVRQQLACDGQTGGANLSYAKQRQINMEVMRAYRQAVAGIRLPNEAGEFDERALCAICMESLQLEPASKLPCNHTLHTDCLLEWLHHDLQTNDKRARCPFCRQEFRALYEGLMYTEEN